MRALLLVCIASAILSGCSYHEPERLTESEQAAYERVSTTVSHPPLVTIEQERDAPHVVNIRVKGEMTPYKARELASMAWSRLGDRFGVWVYDGSEKCVAHAGAGGVESY